MRARVCIGCLAIFSLFVGCQITIEPIGRAEDDFSITRTFEDVDALNIRWRNGKVTVSVDSTVDRITATGTKVVTGGGQQVAEEALEDFEILFTTSDGSPGVVTLRFLAPSQDFLVNATADVQVRIPAGVLLDVDNDNGDVSVMGNTAMTDVNVDNGDVSVTSQRGDTFVDVDNGDVTVRSDLGDVEIEVSNGRIVASARPGDDGELVARTGAGAVSLEVPADTAASLELSGSIGGVTVDLGDFTISNFSTTPTRVSATLNGGGGRIAGDTNVGTVTFGSL